MKSYSYPIIITYENKTFWTSFIDIPTCLSAGDNITQCLQNSKKALLGYLALSSNMPKPTSNLSNIALESNEFTAFVTINDKEIETASNKLSNKSIKKTLTIPLWLNNLAIEQNINFSQVLQKALKKELNIE